MTGASPPAASKPDAPSGVVGRSKTFGPLGPPHLVGNAIRRLEDGDQLVPVSLVQSGQVAGYRLSHILDDPDAV
ncbi:hypothetical protein D621_02860 [beta proteobacterium AAP51]|nr:hypothetical protein D621_02860 [beta proteobacterium AAP51]